MDKGYEQALREVYAIDNIAALEQDWREFAMTSPQPMDATKLAAFAQKVD